MQILKIYAKIFLSSPLGNKQVQVKNLSLTFFLFSKVKSWLIYRPLILGTTPFEKNF